MIYNCVLVYFNSKFLITDRVRFKISLFKLKNKFNSNKFDSNKLELKFKLKLEL